MIRIYLIVLFVCLFSCDGGDEGDFSYEHNGLYWSDISDDYMTWDEAVTYCENLGGRLPNITELRTIIINCPGTMTGGACAVNESDHLANMDYSEDCYCDGSAESYSALGDSVDTVLWSSSEQSDNADRAWFVRFEYGYVDWDGDKSKYGCYVRCVK
ncbi:MAG TPA: DUF1566 domain-containing protein [bacterium]|nr:DUF1566 domain-containing protein [bacterium]